MNYVLALTALFDKKGEDKKRCEMRGGLESSKFTHQVATDMFLLDCKSILQWTNLFTKLQTFIQEI